MISKGIVLKHDNRLWLWPAWFSEVGAVRTFPRIPEVLKKKLEIGGRAAKEPRGYYTQLLTTGTQVTAVLTVYTANRSIRSSSPSSIGSHGSPRLGALGVWGRGKEKEKIIIERVRFDHQSTGWAGAGVFHSTVQYGKMAWSLFLLVNSLSNGWLLHND